MTMGVLVPTVGTYVELRYIQYFRLNKSQKFEGISCAPWILLVLSNTLKGFPSVPCGRGYFFIIIKPIFEKQRP